MVAIAFDMRSIVESAVPCRFADDFYKHVRHDITMELNGHIDLYPVGI
jgi:hypothetical protein